MAEVVRAQGMLRYFEWVRSGPRQREELREKLRLAVEGQLRAAGVDVSQAVYHYEDYPGAPRYERDDRTGKEHRVGLTIRGEGPLLEELAEGLPV
jgi:hypothetical protein